MKTKSHKQEGVNQDIKLEREVKRWNDVNRVLICEISETQTFKENIKTVTGCENGLHIGGLALVDPDLK